MWAVLELAGRDSVFHRGGHGAVEHREEAESVAVGESLRDDRNSLGIVADVKRMAWCASQVRSRLSGSYWRVVLDLQRQLQRASMARGEPREALDRLILSLSALAGFAFDDMTHDEGWRLKAMVAFGYPRGRWAVAKDRRPVHEVSSLNRWGRPLPVRVPGPLWPPRTTIEEAA